MAIKMPIPELTIEPTFEMSFGLFSLFQIIYYSSVERIENLS